MAEIVQMSGKGRRRGSRARKAASRRGRGRAWERGSKGAGERGEGGETQERAVEGHGVDRLRTAAERRVAQSSEELAELLMTKALEGKLESVKMLMKLAEEEKERKEEEGDGGPGILEAFGYRMVEPEVGDVWVGDGWQNSATGEILKGRWEAPKAEQWKAA